MNSFNTLSTESIPTRSPIMEFFPSSNIKNKVRKTLVVDPLITIRQASAFKSPSHFTVLGVVDEVDKKSSSLLILTRRGNETKILSTTKTWNRRLSQRRGRHGRCGRGSYH